jgi:hypothetical protein
MDFRIYRNKETNIQVQARASSTQPGIIVFYRLRKGRPGGRCQARTVEEFNEQFVMESTPKA